MEGLRESVNAFKNEVQDVDAKTVMDLMIVTQYFDMMRDSQCTPGRRPATSRAAAACAAASHVDVRAARSRSQQQD